jgi:hypothetical protein
VPIAGSDVQQSIGRRRVVAGGVAAEEALLVGAVLPGEWFGQRRFVCRRFIAGNVV